MEKFVLEFNEDEKESFELNFNNAEEDLILDFQDSLSVIKVGESGSYNTLDNKPMINGLTLIGDKSSEQLGLATSIQGERADTALQATSSISDTISTFDTALAREPIVSGDKTGVVFGKISKFLTDLGSLAFSSKNVPNGEIVGTNDTQVLTNKVINAEQLVNKSINKSKLEDIIIESLQKADNSVQPSALTNFVDKTKLVQKVGENSKIAIDNDGVLWYTLISNASEINTNGSGIAQTQEQFNVSIFNKIGDINTIIDNINRVVV